ncbi:hypothetical protein AMTRI_Chr05g71400 [Amborella trichopoda]
MVLIKILGGTDRVRPNPGIENCHNWSGSHYTSVTSISSARPISGCDRKDRVYSCSILKHFDRGYLYVEPLFDGGNFVVFAHGTHFISREAPRNNCPVNFGSACVLLT